MTSGKFEDQYPNFMTPAHLVSVATTLLILTSSVHNYRPLKMALCLALVAWYGLLGLSWLRRNAPAGIVFLMLAVNWSVCAWLRYLLDYA